MVGASSGFPVELGGTKELHAAFLTESRTREHWWCRIQEIRVAPSSFSHVPRFPVEVGGVVALHAAFLEESRTRDPVRCCVTGNSGTLGRTWGTHSFRYSIRHGWGRPQQMQISSPEAGQQRDHERPGAGFAPLCGASAWPRQTTCEDQQGRLLLVSPAPTPVPEYCRCCLALRLRG